MDKAAYDARVVLGIGFFVSILLGLIWPAIILFGGLYGIYYIFWHKFFLKWVEKK